MSPAFALLGSLALLCAAISVGMLLRYSSVRVGRARQIQGEDRLSPAAFGATSFGSAGTIVQFSTEYCARCPGVRRVLSELSAGDAGLEFVHVDLTHDVPLAKRFGVLQTPTVLLIDRDGRPSRRLSGAISHVELRDAIDTLTRGPQ